MVWPRRRRAAAMLPSGGSEAQLTAYAAPSGGSAADSDGSLATSRRTAQDRLLRDPASEGQLRDARRGRFLGTSVPAEQSRVPLEMRACTGRWHASAGGAWERLQARHEGRKLRPQNPRAKSLSSMHRFGRQTRRSGGAGCPDDGLPRRRRPHTHASPRGAGDGQGFCRCPAQAHVGAAAARREAAAICREVLRGKVASRRRHRRDHLRTSA